MEATRYLTIHYNDGTSETFVFPKQASDRFEMMRKLNVALSTDRLVIEADRGLHVIPMTAVKRLEFTPVPTELPDGVIRGATLSL